MKVSKKELIEKISKVINDEIESVKCVRCQTSSLTIIDDEDICHNNSLAYYCENCGAKYTIEDDSGI